MISSEILSRALRMHDYGATWTDIASILGVDRRTITRALFGRTDRGEQTEVRRGVTADYALIATHVYRKPAERIKQVEVMPAARSWIAGQISREEMLRRIAP